MPPRPGSAIPTGSSGRGRRPLPDEGHLPPGAWGAGARAWEAGLSGRPGVPLHPRPRHQRLHARAYVASDGVGARRGGEESRGFKDCALRLGRSSTAPTTPGTHRRSRSGMRPARRFAYTTRGWTWQRRQTPRPGSRGTLRGCLPVQTRWWSLPGTGRTGGSCPAKYGGAVGLDVRAATGSVARWW